MPNSVLLFLSGTGAKAADSVFTEIGKRAIAIAPLVLHLYLAPDVSFVDVISYRYRNSFANNRSAENHKE